MVSDTVIGIMFFKTAELPPITQSHSTTHRPGSRTILRENFDTLQNDNYIKKNWYQQGVAFIEHSTIHYKKNCNSMCATKI